MTSPLGVSKAECSIVKYIKNTAYNYDSAADSTDTWVKIKETFTEAKWIEPNIMWSNVT